MTSSIQWKLVSIYLSVVLIVMIVSGSFILYSIEKSQYEDIQKQLRLTADTVELQLELNTTSVQSQDRFEYVVERLKQSVYPYQQEVYIVDLDGRVIIGTGNNWKEGSTVQSSVLIEAISTNESALADTPRFFNAESVLKSMDYAKPVLEEKTSRPIYILYVTTDTTEIYENMQGIIKTIGLASIIAIILAGVLGIIFSRMITKPIKALTKSAKELASGKMHNKIPVESNDEIGQLTGSYNYMAQELSRTLGVVSNEKSKLETILAHMADGVLAFDKKGVLIHANPATYEMLGIRQMDQKFDAIFPGIGLDVSFHDLIQASNEEVEGRMINHNNKFLNVQFAPYKNIGDEAEGIVVVLQDVTKQEKLDKMRKEFVANVSHELRTPLTTVKSYAETLADGAIDDKEVSVKFLNVITSETDRMTDLVKELLELSRLDNKQIELEISEIDIIEVINTAVMSYDLENIKNGQEIIVSPHQEKVFLEADKGRIKQVLHNIISNAIKYNTREGQVLIRTRDHNNSIEIIVEDTGLGIPEEDLSRLYERFYRVDKARSGKMRGTGLGLAITKEIVQLHKGTVDIKSKLGLGTQVSIILPKRQM